MASQSRDHGWLRRARGVILEGQSPPFYPTIEFDALHTVRMMKRIGAETVLMGAVGKWANFANEFLPAHPDLAERDLIAELVEAARVEKMHVIISLPIIPALSVELVEKSHPEWRWIGPNGRPRYLSLGVGGPVTPVCLNTPYRLAFFGMLQMIASKYEIHGLCFECLSPPDFDSNDVCHCEQCTAAVMEKFGRELPRQTVLRTEEQEMMSHFRKSYRQLRINVVKEACEAVSAIKAVPLIYMQGNSPARLPREAIGAFDAVVADAGDQLVDHMNHASMAQHQDTIVLQRVAMSDHWPRLMLGRNENAHKTIASLACGAAPMIAQGSKLFYDEVKAPPIARAFGFMVRNSEALADLQPVRYASVYTSAHTPEKATKEVRGLSFALAGARVPATLIGPATLSSPAALAQYPVLCLGDVRWLSDKQIAAIDAYVRQGGGLVATHQTSLFDAMDKKKEAFGLGPLLGIRPMKPSMDLLNKIAEYHWHGEPHDMYIALAEQEAAALDTTTLPERLPQAPFVAIDAEDDVFVAAHTLFGGDGEQLCPAITLREIDQGRAVYISSALGSLYFDRRPPAVLDLIEACVQWAGGGAGHAGEGRPFSVFGPPTLYALMNDKPGLRVLFLLNYTGEKHEIPGAPCEHFAPLTNVAVRLRTTNVGLVRELVSGREIDFERDENGVRVTVPTIEEFAALAFYEQGPKADPGLKL